MSIQKIRWSKVYESPEEELLAFLRARNKEAVRIVAEASTEQTGQTPQAGSTIWCAEGSLYVRADSTRTSLQPGDALRIDGQTAYELHAGITGYVCYVSS